MSPRERKGGERRLRDRIPERLRSISLRSPILFVPLVALHFAAVVLLLSPLDMGARPAPAPGNVAQEVFRAKATFSVEEPDPGATDRALEASRSQRRIYRHDPGVRETQMRSVSATSSELAEACLSERERREQIEREHAERRAAIEQRGAEAEPEEGPSLDEELAAEDERHRAALREHEEANRRTAAETRAAARRRLGREVSDISIEALASICFPEELGGRAKSLISWLLDEDILAKRSDVATEYERGIEVLRPGQESPRLVREPNELDDQESARERMAESARTLFSKQRRQREDTSYYHDRDTEEAFVDLVSGLVQPTIRFDREATEAAKRAAAQRVKRTRTATYQKGQIIVAEGEIVESGHIPALEFLLKGRDPASPWRTTAGVVLSALLLFLLLWFLVLKQGRALGRTTPRHLLLAGTLLVAQLGLVKLSLGLIEAVTAGASDKALPAIAFLFAMPLAAGTMLLRLSLGAQAAVVFSVGLTALLAISFSPLRAPQFYGSAGVYLIVLTLLSSLVAVGGTAHIRRRVDILQAGVILALFNAATVFGFVLYDGAPLTTQAIWVILGALVGGLGNAFVVGAFAPLFEWLFGYTTNIKLLELASLNQPVLKRLILEAPGTYHHSFLVGNLVESVAETIGANPLLARVAALYHDLGKLKNPQYYGENQQRGENRHDRLQPSMSALILRGHVKDSVRMAAEAGLGRDILDIIEQHHGTTLARFFYNKALELRGEDEPPPREIDYRYPGPKPQSREAGLVLLADAVEAAVRAMPEKSPSRIQGTVRTIILEKFQDGQLDECDLTLRSLNRIEEIFTTVLQGVHHARPEYPQLPGTGILERA